MNSATSALVTLLHYPSSCPVSLRMLYLIVSRLCGWLLVQLISTVTRLVARTVVLQCALRCSKTCLTCAGGLDAHPIPLDGDSRNV
jgi:hypothetical protein